MLRGNGSSTILPRLAGRAHDARRRMRAQWWHDAQVSGTLSGPISHEQAGTPPPVVDYLSTLLQDEHLARLPAPPHHVFHPRRARAARQGASSNFPYKLSLFSSLSHTNAAPSFIHPQAMEKAILPSTSRRIPQSPSVKQERRWGSVTDLTPQGILQKGAAFYRS